MGFDTGIASRLRAAGVPVVEVAGWTSRGSSSFTPQGSVNHHTAGPPTGATPSLNTCIYGRPDLDGPLCNVFQSREGDGNDKAYVIAAGRANHAGDGSWRGLMGNSSVYGLEIEHDGVTALPQRRIERAALIHAAMFGGPAADVCQHYEWTTRKIDAATNVPGDWFRELVAQALEDEDDMPSIDEIKTAMRQVLNEGTGSGQTGWPGTSKATLGTVQGNRNLLNAINANIAAIGEELGTPVTAAVDVPGDDDAAED